MEIFQVIYDYDINQMYKKSVRDCKKTLTKLQNAVNEKQVYNKHLDQQAMECQVSVAEQEQVENLAGKFANHLLSSVYKLVQFYFRSASV